MLGKLFGFKKNNPSGNKATHQAQPVASNTPKQPKVRAPSILEQLTHGKPIETITDLETLHQLVKHSDKLDKKTNRLVRDKLQTLKEQDKEQLQQHEKQEKICTRLETLSRLQHHPLFDSELNHLQQQWQNFQQHDAELGKRVETATTHCLRIQTEATALLTQAALIAKQDSVATEPEQATEPSSEQLAEQALLKAEQALQAEQLAAAELKKQQQKAQSQADREKHDSHQQEIRKTLQQKMLQLEEAIDNADSKKARELQEKIRDNLKKLDHKHAHEFDGKLHLLSGQLHDLLDWQSFAAMPKLEELCAAMEKLVGTALPAPQKAEAVRELQNQWRATKPPSGKPAQALWDRFKKASDQAWIPCAIYFDKEKQTRAFNLQQRQTICEALEQFFTTQDWGKADWKAIARIMEKAKQEFHDFHPVERSEDKPVRTRFDKALAAINGKLLEEQQVNEEKKRQLVEAAKSIATMTDLDKAADRVRQLQDQWKLIGLTRRHEDQKLWQQLQEQTAIVFDKRRGQQQQQRQSENDNIEQAKNLCMQIAALATLTDAELTQSHAEFERLHTAYKAATADIPEKLQHAVKKAFYAANDAYRSQLAGISQRQHQAQLHELARRAQLCHVLETQASDSAIAAVQEQWQQQNLPADWEKAIDHRRQQAIAAVQNQQTPDYKSNEQQRRELCIELEILLGADTPEEDRPLRREYQLRKLQQGLGQAATNQQKALLEQLIVQWHCASPASGDVQNQLQARFDAAQKRAAL